MNESCPFVKLKYIAIHRDNEKLSFLSKFINCSNPIKVKEMSIDNSPQCLYTSRSAIGLVERLSKRVKWSLTLWERAMIFLQAQPLWQRSVGFTFYTGKITALALQCGTIADVFPIFHPNQQEGDGWRQKLNFSNIFFGSSEWQLEHKQATKTGISVRLLKFVREVGDKRERFHGLIYYNIHQSASQLESTDEENEFLKSYRSAEFPQTYGPCVH